MATDKGWWYISEYGVSAEVDGIPIQKVEVFKSSDEVQDYYGEYPQGWEGKMWITFRVGNRFFRKMGTISSYGDEKWDGRFQEVFATEKTVTVFEFKEEK
jgi:hypothetical protein